MLWSQAAFAQVDGSAVQCSATDFRSFLADFSADASVQRAHVEKKITALGLVSTDGSLVPSTHTVAATSLAFPLISPTKDSTESLDITVDGSTASLVDKRQGLSDIKVFSFRKRECWTLSGIEDWSIPDDRLQADPKPGMTRREQLCFQRGVAFANLAGPEQYPLTKEFYEAAQQNYQCAAESGDPQASYAAASLSMSQMAPFLGFEATEKLFKAAAKSDASAALMLSTFYCDGGDSSGPDGPCKDPIKAKAALIQAANLGNGDALLSLADAAEKGLLGPVDLSTAYSCYVAAEAKDVDGAAAAMLRLKAMGFNQSKADDCH